MRTRTLRVGELSVVAVDSEGAGPPIVLCHGNSCSSRSFRRQLEGDLGRAFRLIAIDWPGHGDSERAPDPDRTNTIPGYAGVLADVMRQLDVEDAVVVGWSLGGHAVLEATERLPRAAGFLVFGTPPVGFPPPLDRAFLPNPAIQVAFQAESPEEQVRAFVGSFVRPGAPVPAFFREDYDRTDPRARAALAASLRPGGYRDEVEIVARLDRPLAIVHGAQEQIADRRYLDGLTMPTLWRGAVQEIPDAGHAPQWETPEAFDALVAAFARDCAR